MRVLKALRDFFTLKPQVVPTVGHHELFQKDGWGPARPSTHPHHYRGPMYPAPMHPAEASTKPAVSICNAAREAWSRKDFVAAEKAYRAAIDMAPDNPDFPFELAQLFWSELRLQDAENTLESALKVNPNYGPALLSLVRLQVAQGHRQKAILALGRLGAKGSDAGLPTWVELAAGSAVGKM